MAPASDRPAMDAASRITPADRMSLMCADEWRVVRLHADWLRPVGGKAAHRYVLATRTGLLSSTKMPTTVRTKPHQQT